MRYAHVRDGCTCVKAARAARVREPGARPQAHAKLARTRTLVATDLLLRVVRLVGIGALVGRLRSVPLALARALLDSLNGIRFCFCGSIGNKPM